jgi:hypothetical protein
MNYKFFLFFLGWYQTSGSENQVFGSGFPVELYTQMCHDIYDGV